MTALKFALPFIAVCLATPLAAQDTKDADCKTDDYLEAAMAHLESHYRSFPEELFTAQLFLREGFKQAEINPDGQWGPKTQTAMCNVFDTYTKIGGQDGDWGVHRASHTPLFTSWLLKGARANLSDGSVEFPD